MNMRKPAIAVAIAFAAVAATPHARGQEATLAYKWTKGETLRYRMTQTTATTMSGLPNGMPDATLNQVADQVFKMVAEDVAADGTVTLVQSFESMKMEVSSPAGTMAIDAAKPSQTGAPAEQAVQKMFASMIDVPFTVKLTPTGRVQKVEGFTQLLDKMFASMPPDPQAAAAIRQMKAGLSDEQMTAMFSQGFPEFPSRALKAGESWSTSGTVPNPAFGAVLMNTALTLTSVDATGPSPMAKITSKVKMEKDPKAPPPPAPMGLKAEMGTADGSGETTFDLGKGRLQSATVTMTVPVAMSGTAPDGTVINMKTTAKSVVKIDLLEK